MCKCPLPIFDSMEHLEESAASLDLASCYKKEDIAQALSFLKSYKGSKGTFNSYRREIERLIHWSALVSKKSLGELKRSDIEDYITFCQKPPKEWIGDKKPPRFIKRNGLRIQNGEWRPFIIAIKKKGKQNIAPNENSSISFSLSQGAIKELFAILSSFFNYLLQEEYVFSNPVMLIRQKSKFLRKKQGPPKIRRLSDIEWQYVINTAQKLALQNSELHERTLFVMSALYSMYLRISELAASERWTPRMNDFARDSDGNWWFTTVGKGNKERQIAVSDAMLETLKRWHHHLGLSALPTAADSSPLLPKKNGVTPIKSTNYIRDIVQYCFDQGAIALEEDGLIEDAETLRVATVHWLRHTGISDDVKRRPREHVRDDAGHSSSAITDKYIDIHLKERHKSAKEKPI